MTIPLAGAELLLDRDASLQRALGELCPQDLLVELADARLGDLCHECELVGYPPFGDAPLQVLTQLAGLQRRAVAQHDATQRTLGPALVGLGDHGSLEHVGMSHDLVLELDRADPLPP